MSLYVDIEKKLGDFTLRVKFETGQETFAILGPSGSGKSLTLKCIAGVETPDRGVIMMGEACFFDSERKINLPAGKRKIGYLFQDYALFPNMTVMQNIACGIPAAGRAEYRKKSNKKDENKKEEKRKAAAHYIEKFYLTGKENLFPSQLSGGEKQRTALARMLAAGPRMILLDEPFSALDNHLSWQMEQEIMEVIRQMDRNVLLVSHDRNEVFRLADRIGIMENGRLLEMQEKNQLFQSPRTLTAALLTGCKNITGLQKVGDAGFRAPDWGIMLKGTGGEEARFAGFRANYFEIVDEWEPFNVIECEVEKVIEDVFTMIVLFRQKGNPSAGEWSQLRYEISKTRWNEIDKPLRYLRMSGDKIIWIY